MLFVWQNYAVPLVTNVLFLYVLWITTISLFELEAPTTFEEYFDFKYTKYIEKCANNYKLYPYFYLIILIKQQPSMKSYPYCLSTSKLIQIY